MIKKIILIPDVKIKIVQLKKTKKACPMSGWIANNNDTNNVIKKENKYLTLILLYFWLLKTKLIKIIKKGLTNSIGWNLGKKYKSIHLLDPFTSIPINGTRIKKINEKTKTIRENLKSFSWFIEEIKKITIIPKNIKIKCLKKNE